MGKKLSTILQIGSSGRPVSLDLRYGGTDKVIYYLDKEFVIRGYNSLVAAPGDSKVSGRLVETIPQSYCLWNMEGESKNERNSRERYEYWKKEHLRKVLENIVAIDKIDIVHDHPGTGILEAPDKDLQRIDVPLLITLHADFSGKFKEKCLMWKEKIEQFNLKVYFNSISNSQRKRFEEGGIQVENTIYHGIPLNEFPLETNKHNFLFSLGRICPKKGQDLAIKIAKEANYSLIIGGVVNSIYHDYWSKEIYPFLDFSVSDLPISERESYKNKLVEKLLDGQKITQDGEIIYVGALNDKQKVAFYGRARGFLMPIRWSEPFGLTMVESMACGTPVFAYSLGSVQEVVKNEVTGRIISKSDNVDEDVSKMVFALESVNSLNPLDCRNHVEENFTISQEADKYTTLYNKILSNY